MERGPISSSNWRCPQSFRGQDRILEIARRLGATRYLNAPGGRDLYDAQAFADAGIELSFLEPWAGAGGSILQRIADDDLAALAQPAPNMVTTPHQSGLR